MERAITKKDYDVLIQKLGEIMAILDQNKTFFEKESEIELTQKQQEVLHAELVARKERNKNKKGYSDYEVWSSLNKKHGLNI